MTKKEESLKMVNQKQKKNKKTMKLLTKKRKRDENNNKDAEEEEEEEGEEEEEDEDDQEKRGDGKRRIERKDEHNWDPSTFYPHQDEWICGINIERARFASILQIAESTTFQIHSLISPREQLLARWIYFVPKQGTLPRPYTSSRRFLHTLCPSRGSRSAQEFPALPRGSPPQPRRGVYLYKTRRQEGVWRGTFSNIVQ
ncbi:hypothetical protein M8J75_014413 [Diaphorina citri]|nr:hypothetical protein M8J75_014413 [Diaphorina citri]